MPAKKNTIDKKKAAAKKPAAKKAAAKKAAPKKTAVKKAPAAKKKAPVKAQKSASGARPLTEEDVAVAAYFRYEKRIATGDPQDEIADWHAACEELSAAV